MITLTATIELLGQENGEVGFVSTNLLGNNISSQISALLGSRKQGSNPFIIGSSKLGDGSTFSDKVDYFIGNQLSDSGGNFTTPYVFTINGSNISSLVIEFDKENEHHPKFINIDGTNYYDDSIFLIKDLDKELTSHTITISNWNAPLYPLVITGIYSKADIIIDQRNMLSATQRLFKNSDYSMPEFGLVSNGGSIEFNDIYGEIKKYAEKQILQGGLKVSFFLTNTLTKKQEKTGEFITEKWNYDNDNNQVSISLKDGLESLQERLIDGFSYEGKSMTMYEVYQWIVANTTEYETVIPIIQIRNHLKSIKCEYPFLEKGSIWTEWRKLCEVCGLNMFIENNKINITYEFLE